MLCQKVVALSLMPTKMDSFQRHQNRFSWTHSTYSFILSQCRTCVHQYNISTQSYTHIILCLLHQLALFL